MTTDTIVAIITPPGLGGIAALRLSGADSLTIAKKIFTPVDTPTKFPSREGCPVRGGVCDEAFPPRMAVFGTIKADGFTDQGLAIYFKAPNSFTGEDCVEFFTHGGNTIPAGVLQACLAAGARLAGNGEFSKRAVLNGKMDLAQAEGIVEMIQATSNAAVRAGFSLLQGTLSKRVTELQKVLTDCLSEIEVRLDYPEYEHEGAQPFAPTSATPSSLTACHPFGKGELLAHQPVREVLDSSRSDRGSGLKEELINVQNALTTLLATSKSGQMVKNGVGVAIVGRPNVGKSSLMNALLGAERSIVTEVMGTTRDVVKDAYNYKDIQFILSDTAGIRRGETRVEEIGIERSYMEIESADIVLVVLDSSQGLTQEDEKLLKLVEDKPCITVWNKADISSDGIASSDGAGSRARNDNVVCALSLRDGQAEPANEAISHIEVKTSALQNVGISELKDAVYQTIFTGSTALASDQIMLTSLRHKAAIELALNSLKTAISMADNDGLECVSLYIKSAWLALGEITGTTSNEAVLDAIFSKFCLGK
ncbi:MAG: tRNA modification GTPase [Firmicutes bacterium]|nr:tRNA modification GTPase [Bacillota bacterium]